MARRIQRPNAAAASTALVIVGLATAALALHPRATVPVFVLGALLWTARLPRLTAVASAVLLVATLAGARVDATRPALLRPAPTQSR